MGIVGLGRAGWDIHALASEAHANFEVAAVADVQGARRAEADARFSCAAYSTPDELLRDAAVELVVVATPSHTHADLCAAAARAGKAVLCEKPMARDASEAAAMIACAQACGTPLSVFHVRRLHPDFLKVCEIVQSGVLGPLHLIKVQAHSYLRRRDWQTLRCYGGGLLANFGAHYIDRALALAGGEWSDVYSDLRHLISAGDADDHVKVLFRGRDGVLVDAEISNAAASPTAPAHWTILGRYGALTGTFEQLQWRYYDPASVQPRVLNPSQQPSDRVYEGAETLPWVEQHWQTPPHDAVGAFYDALLAWLREGGPNPVPPDEIERLLALFDACRAERG